MKIPLAPMGVLTPGCYQQVQTWHENSAGSDGCPHSRGLPAGSELTWKFRWLRWVSSLTGLLTIDPPLCLLVCILYQEKRSADKTWKNPQRQQPWCMWFLWQNFHHQGFNEFVYKTIHWRETLSLWYLWKSVFLHPTFLLLYNHISHMRVESTPIRSFKQSS